MYIKKLYKYLVKTFIPLLVMAFAISWFVVVMQTLWRFIDDIVGKGVEAWVLMKLLFFISMTVVPLALILGVLVASLMTFGNLGERLELLAMKSAGISLYKIMQPLFVSVVVVAIGLFIFQNHWMIKSQVKFWTYYYSIRNKSPELAIPEGVFFRDLPGYSIYVKKKDKETRLMHNMMIYDFKDGFANATIIVADSGRIYSTANNDGLVLKLYHGESFKNLKRRSFADPNELIPYLRERFVEKEVHVSFDANLNMVDEELLSSQFVGKNVFELKAYTDSMRLEIDSVEQATLREVIADNNYAELLGMAEAPIPQQSRGNATAIDPIADNGQSSVSPTASPSERAHEMERLRQAAANHRSQQMIRVAEHAPSLFQSIERSGLSTRAQLYRSAADRVSMRQQNLFFSNSVHEEMVNTTRKNEFEYHRKFTFPVACLVFFFIGAPLGAIIRKGGLGTPIVTAVLFFIIYYVLDSTGLKMAREGKWQVWLGMWLPTIVLTPIGIWLSYIATKDSAKLNIDTYINWFQKVLGTTTSRKVRYREITMVDVDTEQALSDMDRLDELVTQDTAAGPLSYRQFFLNDRAHERRHEIFRVTERLVDNLTNSRDHMVLHTLANYPFLRDLARTMRNKRQSVNYLLMVFLPIGLLFYLFYRLRTKSYFKELHFIQQNNVRMREALGLRPPKQEQTKQQLPTS